MRVCDVGESGVKREAIFLSCRRVQNYNTIHGYVKTCIFYDHSSLYYVKCRWKKQYGLNLNISLFRKAFCLVLSTSGENDGL